MPIDLSPELAWTAWMALATALMWAPQILWLIADRGLVPALMDGEHNITYTAPWAARADRAHRNAVENLAIFAALAIAVHLTGTGDAATASAAALFFFMRVAHFTVYVAGLSVIRTVLFLVGVGCQLTLGARVVGLA
ncbi:MAG: MAPEG family protein [Pseudomonadota bacterium]